ncbi:FtsK/SpoIIIE domain-containing protein [Actinomyces sp. ZJ308]|uniref:FtsK/SpoIIIE domain-containing protein n=1 Tax=Actinomyces sp. ZJ308 TaxID=2708342 RepID=UPI001FBA687C|nr:FtsK/SpoIIIE domain-containing protein [Actinomyces sp. ZJ308]
MVRNGMLLGLGGPVRDDVEPVGVVELRVVAGRGAGAVHRLSLGGYTLGGPGCDLILEGVEEKIADLAVAVGGRVTITPVAEVAERELPLPLPRRRPLPGPLVLAAPERGEEQEAKGRAARRRRRKEERKRRRAKKKGLDTEAILSSRETLEPDGVRHYLELDRRPLSAGGTEWSTDALLTVGETLLSIGAVPVADAVVSPTAGAPTLNFNRPPRLARPVRETKFALPTKPAEQRKPPFPFAMLISPLVMGAGMYFMTGRVYSLLFMVFSPIMMIANQLQGRSNQKKDYQDKLRKYEEQREVTEEAAFKALTAERGLRRGDHPNAAELLLRATGPRAQLWERRPADPDWLDLRVGVADLPSDVEIEDSQRAKHEEPLRWTAPDVPVRVPLGELGVVGVCGAQRHDTADWLMAQAAVLHSPAELQMVLLVEPVRGENPAGRWAWTRWLPHLRNLEGMGARAKVGLDDETIARRINELSELVERRLDPEKRGPSVGPEEQILVVLDGARGLRLRPGLISVLRRGPAAGVRLVCIDRDRTALPEECRAVVMAEAGAAGVSQADVDEVERVTLDVVPGGWCERVARALAPVHDVSASGADSTIPTASRLLDVLPMPDPDAQAVLAAWERCSRTTRAVIGEDAEGHFWLDVRADGPHALVAGTTGSGKSELLQTLIASLCVGNTPDSMTFVLVDYKGGAAFKDCARLPHTVGMVTDLDGHLTSRALESLGAELRRREHQLAGADAKDIEDYVAAMAPGDEPMPRLMIIIDEFAALVSELPDFVTGLVDIARRGRSLGVHLVLATQRPAGVVSAEIKSNTNLRIALRVTDENDSQDVIEASNSAYIPPSIPGRAYARLGHASLRQFQSSRVGGRPRGATPQAAVRAATLTLDELSRPEMKPPEVEEDATIPTDLATLVSAMGAAHEATGRPDPHSPWLPPLPELVTLGQVAERIEAARAEESAGGDVADPRAEGFLPPLPLGLEDLPGEQAQRPMVWDYTRGGHLGVAGAPRSGRSSVLRGIAVALAESASAAEVHAYGIDAGNGALAPCVGLPNFGAVVSRDQADRIRRMLALLGGQVAYRQQYLATHGYASVAEQRAATPPSERLPYLVLLIDRWDNFMATFENTDAGAIPGMVETLMREGPAVGLRVVIAGDRTVFRGRFGMMLEDRLVLRMPSADDFDLIAMRARDVPLSMPQGRAFRSGERPREVQLVMLGDDPAGTAQVAAVHRAAERAESRWGVIDRAQRPGHVDELPVAISTEEALRLEPKLENNDIAFAVGGDDLRLLPVSLEDIGNAFLVTGPRRSGRSTALYFATSRLLDNGQRVVLVLPRRSPLAELAQHPNVVGVLGMDAEPGDLTELLAEDPENIVIVVDDFDTLTNDHSINPTIEAHIKTCRDHDGGVLVACGIDEVGGMYRGVVATARKTRTGLVLAPRSADDGSHFSARLPRSIGGPVPKGRAVQISTTGWTWTQVPRQVNE